MVEVWAEALNAQMVYAARRLEMVDERNQGCGLFVDLLIIAGKAPEKPPLQVERYRACIAQQCNILAGSDPLFHELQHSRRQRLNAWLYRMNTCFFQCHHMT